MSRTTRLLSLFLALLLLPTAASALVEKKTGTEYPDQITVGDVTLIATGAALREKTFLKIDVYTIASYIEEGTVLSGDKGKALREVKAHRQLRMDLCRSFSREKLINAFREVIEKNYDDLDPLAADMAVFEGYFIRDAQEGDVILFTYLPGVGVTTNINGDDKGTIANPQFVEALWSVWFGNKPANGGMKKRLLGEDD